MKRLVLLAAVVAATASPAHAAGGCHWMHVQIRDREHVGCALARRVTAGELITGHLHGFRCRMGSAAVHESGRCAKGGQRFRLIQLG